MTVRPLALVALLACALAASLAHAWSTPPAAASPSKDETPMDQTPSTPAQLAEQHAYEAWHGAFVQALADSPNPHDRLIALEADGLARLVGMEASSPAHATYGTRLRAIAQAAPDDYLVQLVWAGADPGNSGCDAGHPCPERARAAARVDPDNAAAWLPVLAESRASHDAKAVEATLARMAASSRFEEPMGDELKDWLDAYDRHPPPATLEFHDLKGHPIDDVAKLQVFVEGMAIAAVHVLQPYQHVVQLCDRKTELQAPPQRFVACAAIGRLMLASNTQVSRMVGRAVLRKSGLATADDAARGRIVAWQFDHMMAGLPGVSDDDPMGFGQVRVEMDDWQSEGNEIAVLERQLRRAKIPLEPPADWQPTRGGKPQGPLGEDLAAPAGQAH
jgi:hypothetical protein